MHDVNAPISPRVFFQNWAQFCTRLIFGLISCIPFFVQAVIVQIPCRTPHGVTKGSPLWLPSFRLLFLVKFTDKKYDIGMRIFRLDLLQIFSISSDGDKPYQPQYYEQGQDFIMWMYYFHEM